MKIWIQAGIQDTDMGYEYRIQYRYGLAYPILLAILSQLLELQIKREAGEVLKRI